MTMAVPGCFSRGFLRLRDSISRVGWPSAARKARTLYACSCHRKKHGAARTRPTEDTVARDYQEFLPPCCVFPDTKASKTKRDNQASDRAGQGELVQETFWIERLIFFS